MTWIPNWFFSSFKIGNLFGVKDPDPDGLRSRVAYKFICAGCNACYVGETCSAIVICLQAHVNYATRFLLLRVRL